MCKPSGSPVAHLIAVVVMASSTLYGQSTIFDDVNPLAGGPSGVRIYGATISGSYFKGGYGIGLRAITPEMTNDHLGMGRASVTVGWSGQGRKGYGSIVYSPSYVRGINLSGYESWNHSLSVSTGRSLTTKWDLGFSANSIISDFSQLLFARSQRSIVAGVPATFEEFVAAIMTGRTTNPALSQAVSASPILNGPESAFVYGDRLLTASASVSASYAYSSRSVFRMGTSGSRAQQFRKGSSLSEGVQSFVVPNTSAGTLDLSWSYSLTPRTTASVNFSSARTFSRFQDAYSSQANFALGRTMSRHWFVQGIVGVGKITPVRQTFSVVRQAQTQYGGTLGYKVYSHALVASYMHAVSDIYGLGANTMDTGSGGWSWRRPGSSVSLSATAGYSKMNGAAFRDAKSWMANVGIGKALTSQLVLSVGASYTQFPQSVFLEMPDLTQKGVVVSLNWSPGERR